MKWRLINTLYCCLYSAQDKNQACPEENNVWPKTPKGVTVTIREYSNILCVFWNTTLNEWSEEGCKWKKIVDNRSSCECTHLTSFSVLMSKIPVTLLFQDEITYVGLGVSICSLLIFLIIEALVWSAVVKSNLSHFRHTALVNISLCLLLADCSFLAACFSSIKTSTWCLILTVTKQFFFLAMFCWMLCLSIILLHQLIFIFHPLRKSVYLLLSTILGYICPTVIVSATYVYYKYTGKPYHNTETCWLTYEGLLKGSIHAFLLPVGTIVLMNLFSMAVVIMTLLKSTVSDGSKADEKEAAKSIMKVMVFLTPVFGVTWALGFFVLLTDVKAPMGVVMRYAFTIINSFQVLFHPFSITDIPCNYSVTTQKSNIMSCVTESTDINLPTSLTRHLLPKGKVRV
uniref:Adhesion G protein-coupled receptor F3b n=1 Tax=Salmo trutta TaxID=8032 RepID=A0A674CPS1_SALTR